MNNLIPIERKEGVTIYGRIVGKGGKLGQYEVHSSFVKGNNTIYTSYSEAEDRMKFLIGVRTGESHHRQ